MSLFENATRQKYRYFIDNKKRIGRYTGFVTTEDLWDLSLEELDETAIALNKEIKATQEESFLARNTTDESLTERLEVLKAVIQYKQAQEELRQQEAARKAEREKLLELIDQKKYQELSNLSVEELKERLTQL